MVTSEADDPHQLNLGRSQPRDAARNPDTRKSPVLVERCLRDLASLRARGIPPVASFVLSETQYRVKSVFTDYTRPDGAASVPVSPSLGSPCPQPSFWGGASCWPACDRNWCAP